MDKRIYIFTEYFGNQNTSGKIWLDISKELSKEYSVFVYTNNYNLDDPTEISFPVEKIGLASFKSNLIFRTLKQLEQSFRFLLKLLKVRKQDKVFFGTNPLLLVFAVYFAKRIKGFKSCILVHDIFPENLVVLNLFNQDSHFLKIVGHIYNEALAYMDHHIVLSMDMLDVLKLKIKQNNITIIPNWISYGDYQKLTTNLPCNTKEKIVIRYLGNLGFFQGIPDLLNILIELNINTIQFEFYGSGVHTNIVKECSDQNSKIVYGGAVEMSERHTYLMKGDIALIVLGKGMKGLAVPSKLQYELATGKPLLCIADKGSFLDEFVNRHNVGWFVPWTEPEQMICSIREIILSFRDVNNEQDSNRIAKSYLDRFMLPKFRTVLGNL